MNAAAPASIFLITLLATPAAAQGVGVAHPVPGAVKHAGTLHLATGTWTRTQTYGLGASVLFRSDLPSGYFGLQDEDRTYFDEGRLPGSGKPLRVGEPETGTADVYRITSFEFGYCAMDPLAPVTVGIGFFDDRAPCTPSSTSTLNRGFDLTGLPNGGCWILNIDLTGTTSIFELRAEGADGFWDDNQDDDTFGWSIDVKANQGSTGNQTTGLLLTGDNTQPATEGIGTVFKDPAATAATGLGTRDILWLETAGSGWSGCYFFGGCLPCANFHLVLEGEELTSDVLAYCDPGSANSVSGTGAQLTSPSGFGSPNARFRMTDVPDQFGVLFSGPDALDLPFGCGRRCVGGSGVVRYGPFLPLSNLLEVTIDMNALPNRKLQYWYRDPANASCGATFNLSNALGY